MVHHCNLELINEITTHVTSFRLPVQHLLTPIPTQIPYPDPYPDVASSLHSGRNFRITRTVSRGNVLANPSTMCTTNQQPHHTYSFTHHASPSWPTLLSTGAAGQDRGGQLALQVRSRHSCGHALQEDGGHLAGLHPERRAATTRLL